jgi:hypothetical protein
VNETFGREVRILLDEFVAEVGDFLTKFAEPAVSFSDVSAELRAAQPVAFDRVVDGPVGEFRHIKKITA